MPILFVSYKRGTTAVAPLMEKLTAAHYRLWFDRDEIHLGDPDWQARIDTGLERADGMILCISPAACASEPVRYEVRKARVLNKPIFPLILERTDYDTAIHDLGLAERQHIEDFTDVTRWHEQIERLLRDLEAQGLRVTPHERRRQRDPHNPSFVLHQTYLKQTAERLGRLDLAQINPERGGSALLEDVYIDSPTAQTISVEVKNWQIVDWWLGPERIDVEAGEGWAEPLEQAVNQGKREAGRTYPESHGYARPPLETLIAQIENRIADYRQKNPERKPTDRMNSWRDGARDNQLVLQVQHIAAACDRLVVLGAPGSGKSTFVRHLALCLAGAQIDGWARGANLSQLDAWTHGALTPVYVELRRFVASRHFPASMTEMPDSSHLWAYITHEILGESLKAYADELRYDLEHGHAVLILDGLDEIPYPEGELGARRDQLVTLCQSINTQYTQSRVIITSRPYAYEGWKRELPGYHKITIAAFEDRHRIGLAERLYRAAGLDAENAAAKARALNRQLGNIDPELKDRPLFVTLMATLFLRGEEGGLPTRRGALYRRSILLLLDRWTQTKADVPSLVELLGDKTVDDLYVRLAALAYDVHERYGERPGTPEIEEGLLYHHLKPAFGRRLTAELIPYLSENAGVLVSPGQNQERDVFHFAHRTFQEYLAGAHLVSLCTVADSFAQLRDLMVDRPQIWRVPCTLAGDVLADTERKSELWKLLAELLEDDPPTETDNPRWWLVWLAATVALEHDLHRQDKLNKRSEAPIRDALIDWLVALVELPLALPPVERALCGRALGLFGDPRPGVGLDKTTGLPDIVWCVVSAGTFIMGADDRRDNPRREVDIPYDFQVSKYPVTFAQFQAFIDSGEVDDERWWDGMPLAQEDYGTVYQVREMRGQSNLTPNHPRENVLWYQAVAFGRWLTARCHAAGVLPSDRVIRLPTEEEWEKAARGTDGREYPYEGEFDPLKGNTDETGIGSTTAVGLFGAGVSPYGAHDMSGNVWEWCQNGYVSLQTISLENNENQVVRGGSFGNDQLDNCCAVRDFDPPDDGDGLFGFRLVASVPIAPL